MSKDNMKVIFNIGSKETGVINLHPMYFDGKDFKEFSDWIRGGMFDIMTWAHDFSVPISGLCLYLHIHEDLTGNMQPRKSKISEPNDDDWYYDWNITVHCKNIREYKPFLNLKWEEIDQMVKARKREVKINSVIDE